MKNTNRFETLQKIAEIIEVMYNNPTTNGDKAFKEFVEGSQIQEDQSFTNSMQLHEIMHNLAFLEGNREITYSTDYDKYDEEVKDFMDYVALTKESEEFAFICVRRDDNTIRYYKMREGSPIDMHSITMTGNDNLKEIYESLKVAYGPEFKHGHKHEMINGWSLLPVIGDNVIIDIDSNEPTDKNWIYEEVHQKPAIVDEPQQSNHNSK